MRLFHLAPATVEKIVKGEYVDVFSLLNKEVEEKILETLAEKGREKLRHKAPDICWDNWLPEFFIYADVIVKAQIDRAASLIKYMDFFS